MILASLLEKFVAGQCGDHVMAGSLLEERFYWFLIHAKLPVELNNRKMQSVKSKLIMQVTLLTWRNLRTRLSIGSCVDNLPVPVAVNPENIY